MVLALFDFDGTITTHETMPDFLRRSIPRRRLITGRLLLAPLVLGYRLRLVSGTQIRRAVVRFGYSGVPTSTLAAAGRDFARDYLPNVLRPEAMRRIAWHKAEGHTVVVVSGGLDVYLDPWCQAHGLKLLCSSLEHREDLLTGRYEGQQCVRKEKVRRVRERYDLGAFTEVYAYGDTPEDHDLLGIATRKYYRWEEVGIPNVEDSGPASPSRRTDCPP